MPINPQIRSAVAFIDSHIETLQRTRTELLDLFGSAAPRKLKTTRVARKVTRRPKMTAAQKRAVSARMKAYWAKRRAAK